MEPPGKRNRTRLSFPALVLEFPPNQWGRFEEYEFADPARRNKVPMSIWDGRRLGAQGSITFWLDGIPQKCGGLGPGPQSKDHPMEIEHSELKNACTQGFNELKCFHDVQVLLGLVL